jgi:integrase
MMDATNTTIETKKKRTTKRRGSGEGCIYQRHDGKWAAVLNWGYDDKGKRRRKFVYGKTKAEVANKLTELQSNRLNGTLTDCRRRTVQEFLAYWLETSAKGRTKPTTFSTYSGAIKNHINPAIGGMQLGKLAPHHVQAIYARMEAEGHSGHVRRHVHVVLHKACWQAVRWGMIARNPVDAVDPPQIPKTEAKSFTLDQSRAILTAAKGDKLEALFVLALTTGMRLGELLGLQWESVNLTEGYLTVRHSLLEVGGNLTLGEPKTAKSRRKVPLSQMAVDALWAHRRAMLAKGWGTDGHVFRSRNGTPIRRTHFRSYSYQPLLARAGVPFVKFHTTRHTAASLALADGESVKLVSEMLGHSNASITLNVYAHVLPTQHRARADRMGELLAVSAG